MPEINPLNIHISDNAIMHLLMSGLECYMVRYRGDKITVEKQVGTETAGTLWGYFIPGSKEDYDHVCIEHISHDVLADRHTSYVTLRHETTLAKKLLVSARWPHLSLVGDFHTHPYETLSECESAGGWNFSDGDYKSIERPWEEDELDLWKRYKVSVVLTIAALKRVPSDTQPYVKKGHVIQFQIGRFRFWISAYAVDRVSDESTFLVSPGKRQCRKEVYVDIPTINGTDSWFEYGELRRLNELNI